MRETMEEDDINKLDILVKSAAAIVIQTIIIIKHRATYSIQGDTTL